MKRQFKTTQGVYSLILLGLVLGLATGCANERALKPIIENGKRVPKTALNGTFNYLRALKSVSYPDPDGEFLAPGIYVESDKLVQFVIKETSLDVVSVDPLFDAEKGAEVSSVLLSFPVRHVDILRKQNVDGDDTHEEEETESRRIWSKRDYLIVDLSANKVDVFKKVRATSPSDSIQIVGDSIQFATSKHMENGSVIDESYSFLKFNPESSYKQKLYPRALQERFGVFKTTTYQFDKFGRRTQDLRFEFMNRWDTSQKVVYYLSKDFPTHLKPAVKAVFESWDRAFVAATGKSVLELRENSGQEPGDLRYSMVVYDHSTSDHGLLGYGPSVVNPRTGQIIKADVFIYGGTLRRSVHNERLWGEILGTNARSASINLDASPRKGPLAKVALDQKAARELKHLHSHTDTKLSVFKELVGHPDQMVAKLQARARQEHARCKMEMNADVMDFVASLLEEKPLSDEELELQVFTPLLAHELGHALGLRHNFMGSADEAHYSEGKKSSSVMDYGFLSGHEPKNPAPYDAATIKVAYGQDEAETAKLLAENFFFCTDEHLYDSRFDLCQQFDAGATLSDSALNQMKRYIGSYNFNNRRQDKVSFGPTDGRYIQRILSYLIPLRLLFDHANAIAEAGKPLTQGQAPSAENLGTIWRLAKRRVEATIETENPIELKVSLTQTVKLDPEKIVKAVVDATQAKARVFAYLSLIINETERPEHDAADPQFNELQVRGVVFDKMMSLLVLSIRTSDPLGSGAGVSIFEPLHEQFTRLYAGILSNTESMKDPASGHWVSQLKFYDQNVRQMAFGLAKDLMESPGIEAGEMKELFQLTPVAASHRESDDYKKATALDQKFRELLLEFELTSDPAREKAIQTEVAANRAARDLVKLATIHVRNGLELVASTEVAQFGGIPTASGLLLKSNLGFIESRHWVAVKAVEEFDRRIGAEPDADKKLQLIAQRDNVKDLALVFMRYVQTEKNFVEKLYAEYDPN